MTTENKKTDGLGAIDTNLPVIAASDPGDAAIVDMMCKVHFVLLLKKAGVRISDELVVGNGHTAGVAIDYSNLTGMPHPYANSVMEFHRMLDRILAAML